jgi:hypothetical protein
MSSSSAVTNETTTKRARSKPAARTIDETGDMDSRQAERFITVRYAKMLTNWPVAGGVEDGLCEGIMDYGDNKCVRKHLLPKYAQLAAKVDAGNLDTALLQAMKHFEDQVTALNLQAEKVNDALMAMHRVVEKQDEDDYVDAGEDED